MIKISLSEVVGNIDNLKALQEVTLPVKVSYKIKRLVNKLEPVLKAYGEKKDDLVREFGELQPDGESKVTDPEKLKLFADKLAELLSTEDEVDFEPIKVDDLGNVEIAPKLLVPFVFND